MVYGEDNIFLVVSRSNFSENEGLSSAQYMGGGVAFLQNNVTVTIDSCNFTDNSTIWGGVLYAQEGTTVRIDSCSFIDLTGLNGRVELCTHREKSL